MSKNNQRQKVNYAGRTVDLLLLKTVLSVPAVNHRVDLDVSNAVDEPMIVTGIEKMVQRFAVLFINALGSTKFRENHGTELIPKVGKGLVYDEQTLTSVAGLANLSAKTEMKKGDNGLDTPDDEALDDSEIIDLKFSRETASVKISIKLTSKAGDSYTYIIPVAIGVH